MNARFRNLWPVAALGDLRAFPWRRRPDPTADHGHNPFSAWEAELSAYARHRAGAPLRVTFGLTTEPGWGEELRLARPVARLSRREAFAAAEGDLEHLLMHHRHGWREEALLWHIWAEPATPICLPWPPWDKAGLPPAVIREALVAAVPALSISPAPAAGAGRQRTAARWIAAAWADGAHRALEVAERPGLAERLAGPPVLQAASLWETVLVCLAAGTGESAPLPGDVQTALDWLVRSGQNGPNGLSGAADPAAHVGAVLDVVEVLVRRKALPPSHKQRPPWLRPAWGRWHREAALRAALEQLARSPTSVLIAAATAAGRRRAGGTPPFADRGAGCALPWGGRREAAADAGGDPAQRSFEPSDPADFRNGWGLQPPEALAAAQAASGSDPTAVGREGRGVAGTGSSGAGPGVLGALHVVAAGAEDRAAYWQLRAALAPEIERLIERLLAASDRSSASVPRRFQRAGRLDRNRLPAAVAGREAVFTRFVHEPQPATAFCLLLDCSASMVPYAEQLREVAILLESATAALGAQVTAFTFGATWERMQPPAVGAPLVALGRELRPRGGTPFGPALQAAAAWLNHQPYKEKRLWVFSDGRWSARDRVDVAWRADLLRDVVVWVLTDDPPVPPSPAMRIVAAPLLADLVELAPAHYWGGAARRDGGRP